MGEWNLLGIQWIPLDSDGIVKDGLSATLTSNMYVKENTWPKDLPFLCCFKDKKMNKITSRRKILSALNYEQKNIRSVCLLGIDQFVSPLGAEWNSFRSSPVID
jgi:hypothetical protein